MKRPLSEAAVQKIMTHLLERFGEPIGDAQGDGQGVPSSHKKEDMGNRGFGAKLEGGTCNECGGMMGVEGDTCTSCGEMPKQLPPAGGTTPAVGGEEEVIVVVGGKPNPRGEQRGSNQSNVSAGVHPPKDMEIPPETQPKQGKASGPTAPPSRPVVEEGAHHLTAQEILTTYEDLYLNSLRNRRKADQPAGPPGKVSLEELASWLGVTPEAVKAIMHKAGLLVDREGNVVERGQTPMPFPAVKG